MNYYRRHIGDYLRDTAHLSLLEHGVFARLLDVYYTRESGIPVDQAHRVIGARSAEERDAVDLVLSEFFVQRDGAWHQDRCDREIAAYAEKAEKNRANGPLGGRPKKPSHNHDGLPPEPQKNPDVTYSQEPVASSHKPEEKRGEEAALTRSPPKPRPAKRCPATFEVTDEMRAWAERDAPDVDVDRETAKMRDHEYRDPKSDWPAAWRKWLRNAQDDAGRRRPATGPPRGLTPNQQLQQTVMSGLTGTRLRTIDVEATEIPAPARLR